MGQHKTIVRIENPLDNGSGYTTARKAAEYVARGRATWTVPGKWIRFTEQSQRMVSQAELDREEVDRLIQTQRHGVVYWNGREARGTHRPGEVVS